MATMGDPFSTTVAHKNPLGPLGTGQPGQISEEGPVTPMPPEFTGTGRPGLALDQFLTPAQRQDLARVSTAALNSGQNSEELTATLQDWLRELPDGLLAKAGWTVNALAEVLSLAGLLSQMQHKARGGL